MFQKLLIVAFISLPTVIQSSNSQNPHNSQPILLIYNSTTLPTGIAPVYSSNGTTLAFGGLEDQSPDGAILQYETGDYYLLRVKSLDALTLLENSIPYVNIGRTIIIKTTPEKAESLSQYGWGLTRLSPVEKVKQANPDYLLPKITDADTTITNLISVITPQSSGQVIAALSSIATRYSYAQGCRQAEQYIFDKFDSLHLATSFFTYQYNNVSMRDVIGQLSGVTYPESIIVVCGHLDCTSETPSQRAPGAEDNGTGTAAVVEAARALSGYRTDLTIRFVAFSGEEQGLIGSSFYASYLQGLGEKITAVINVDMVGYSGFYEQDMHIFSDPASYSLGALGAEILSTYTTLDTVPHYGSSPEYGSDHYSFAIRGYPSIFFIDAWDGFDWYPNYHTVADTLGNLNLEQQASVTRAVAAMAATLARLQTHTGPTYLPGDANGSGDVTGLDVVFLVRYFKGMGPAPDPLLRGDANGSCTATGLDVTYLVRYFKGIGPAPQYGNCR